MEKDKNILHGVTLLFCINIIASFITQLAEIVVCKLSLSIYYIPLLNLALYAAILYVVFGKIRKFSEISIFIFVTIFILRAISLNLSTFFLSDVDMKQISDIQSLDNFSSLIYSLVFAGLAYRYYKQKIKEESKDAYVYYGMILFIITDNGVDLITQLLLMASRLIYTPYIIAIVAAVCCITLFVYVFIKSVKNKPAIHPLVMFIVIIAGSLSPLFLKVGNPYLIYETGVYSLIFGFLMTISGFTYLLIAIISYIKYYNLRRTGTKRLGIIDVLIVVFVFLSSLAVNYTSIGLWQNKSFNENLNEMKADIPFVLSDHIPNDGGFRSQASYSGDEYTSLITYHKGGSAVKKGERLLNEGYLGKYEANDLHLVCLDTDRIKKKLKAEKITYSTLNINGVMYYPVPEFNFDDDSDEELNICGLPSDFTIYIIEAKSHKLIEGSNFIKMMPDGWEKGYTKGVCISKQRNIVIYWGAAW